MSSSELKPIILYDIPCITPGLPWSPNTMKTRYCLGYKKLPFTTVWVEFPDIAGLLQSKGITNPPHTLPAIEDPNTGAVIMDSIAIAAYLDEAYPGTPKVLPTPARAALENIGDAFSFGSKRGASASAGVSAQPDLMPRLVFLVLSGDRLNPPSKAYYYQTRADRLGEDWTTLVDACSAGAEARAERMRQGIDAMRDTWRRVTALYNRPGQDDSGNSGRPFAFGEEPCLVDFVVAGRVKFAMDALEPSEAETVRNLEGGRLGRLVEDLERYYKY